MGTIADKLLYLDGTKQAIRSAIESNGVYVDDDDTFRSYAEKIRLSNTFRIDAPAKIYPIAQVVQEPPIVDTNHSTCVPYKYTYDYTSYNKTYTKSISEIGRDEIIICAVTKRGNPDSVEMTYSGTDDGDAEYAWQLIHSTQPIYYSSDYQQLKIFAKKSSSTSSQSLTVTYPVDSLGNQFYSEIHMAMFSVYGIRSLEYDSRFDVTQTLGDTITSILEPADKSANEKLIWFMHSYSWDSWSWETSPADLINQYTGRRIGVFLDTGNGATSRTFNISGGNRRTCGCCALKFTM